MHKQNRRPTKIPSGIDCSFLKDISPETVVKTVCWWHYIKPGDLLIKCRKRSIIEARHIIVYFLSINLDLSFNAIGSLTGQRSHATVMNSRNQIENWMDTNAAFAKDMALLIEVLRIKL